ncbi:MAG: peptidylprolyl isomerase [Muribaculum sp.]|nr:peptidylprolyl isomerase [Muribaculum sp.]
MRKGIAAFVFGALALSPAVAKDNDPTVITVAGKKVPLSEFEYLYNKNNGQQMSPMSVDEYAELFKIYKLKVADALAAGIDTTAAFQAEFKKYRNELAEPYIYDKDEENRLVDEAYAHMTREVKISHVMIDKGRTPSEAALRKATLDSLRTVILNGGDMADIARRYSIDRSAKSNGGELGWITGGRYPYTFENTAYNTPVGEISEVIETPFGYHIVRVEGERPSRGEVLARHILKLTRGKNEAGKELAKAQIDSIYKVLAAGADFADVATRESEDPGSAKDGGLLPWFGAGMMVHEFESVAFSLENGAISEPFSTSYGYHIINRVDSRDIPSLDESREKIMGLMKRDGRSELPRKKRIADLRTKFGTKINDANVASLKEAVKTNGSLDSALVAAFVGAPLVVGEVGGKEFTSAEMFAKPLPKNSLSVEEADFYIDAMVNSVADGMAIDAEIARIAQNDADFRNLINEYHDGMLLFEVSNEKVWNRASVDSEGQSKYFESHRDKYKWDSPKYKGYIVYSVNDSVSALVSDFLKTNPPVDSLSKMLNKQFKHMARAERVLAGKGDNKMVDYLLFGAPQPEMRGVWKHAELYGGEMIDAPQEVADVKGAVIADYQAELEKQWIDDLKSKYPVKVNKKALKKLQ